MTLAHVDDDELSAGLAAASLLSVGLPSVFLHGVDEDVLAQAVQAGAGAVRAETAAGHAGALAVLRCLGST